MVPGHIYRGPTKGQGALARFQEIVKSMLLQLPLEPPAQWDAGDRVAKDIPPGLRFRSEALGHCRSRSMLSRHGQLTFS